MEKVGENRKIRVISTGTIDVQTMSLDQLGCEKVELFFTTAQHLMCEGATDARRDCNEDPPSLTARFDLAAWTCDDVLVRGRVHLKYLLFFSQ